MTTTSEPSKKGLLTSELWMTTIPGLAILTHGAQTSDDPLVQAVCYGGIALLALAYGFTRVAAKNAGTNGGA